MKKTTMQPSEIDVDGILRALGDSKYFHTTQYLIVCASALTASANSFFYIFIATIPEYRCKNLTEFQLSQYNISIREEVNLSYDKCSIDIINTDGGITRENRTLDCLNGYYYTAPVDKSIVSQWDLVCKNNGLAESTQTFYILGQVVSGLLAPYLIERFGRKPIRILSNFFLVVFNLLSAFTPFYWLFAAARFFTGVLREVFVLSSVTLACELYPKEKRIVMTGIFMFIWSMLSCLLGLIAYLFKDYSWNTLFLFNAVVSGYFLVDLLFMEESLRWLFANSKIKAAEDILKKAARQNKIDFDNVWNITLKDASKQQVDSHVNEASHESQNRGTISPIDDTATTIVEDKQPNIEKETSTFAKLLAVFKLPYLRKITIVVSIECAVNMTSLTSIILMLDTLVGSVYLNSTIMFFVDGISSFIYTTLAKRYGHNKALQTTKLFTAICMISAALIKLLAENSQTMDYIFLGLYTLALSGLSAAVNGDYIYISELFPTEIRSAGNGFATTFMRIVCTAAPFFKLLALAFPWVPGIIIGLGCIVSSIIIRVFLPETGNRVLPQTIEEVNRTEEHNTKKLNKIENAS
ncbi:solute carrier family 22 member 6-A [Octopus bimaculoides]|uniref:Major facilitator superfamily (MFS) profile domain-containing protein n=1 Tax=Octopus bimaculoides TaxID=37653 RepID=A0A0L8IF71_OCTBM|nr:solute carrier family 22 member 6-A [Octopus bimaculoides]|eukprot:XP_014770494.1 PREDICTED: solute carrier family 22 member 6-A-like [Octopus bimaculoides]